MSSDKKGGWKDSNWYVSFSGFWREYRRHKIGMLGLVILIFFVGMAFGAPFLVFGASPDPSVKVAPTYLAPAWTSIFDPTGVVTGEYMPDQYLTSNTLNTPHTMGLQASEFSYQRYDGADNQGYVNLTWDRSPTDGPIDWRLLDPSGQLPDSNSFIYFSQTLQWTYNHMPSDVNMTLNLAVTTTGDFHNRTEGGLMFKVYIWLIDSSGNWRQVYQSFPPYSNAFQSRRIDLSYFDLQAAWGGMVPNDQGIKQDPNNNLTVAVGLAPTKNFRNYTDYSPQEVFDGSVTVTIKRVSMLVYGDYYGLLGTTDKGADAWAQLVYGSQVSLTIGVLATALSTLLGVIVGLVAGYFGGKIDEVLMRFVDFLLVIPSLPLMMVLAAFLGRGEDIIIVVIAILGWTGTSRLIRSQVMAEKNKAYVESARAIGASDTYIIFKHDLPNVTPILFANITLGVVGAILSEAGLAFLGLTDPTHPSWGRMLADAQNSGGFSNGAWWVVVFPGLMITILSLSFTFVGHTLDQVLNPRLRER